MRENAEQDLVPLRSRVMRGQCGAEPALQAREDALGLPPLPVQRPREASLHLAPVRGQGPALAHVAAVERDDGLWNAEYFAAEPVVVLRVVAGVAEQSAGHQESGGLADGRRELGRILARAPGDDRASDQVARRLADRRELRPAAAPTAEQGPAPIDEVGTYVAGLEPGRVDSDNRSRLDEAGGVCAPEARVLEPSEGPLFRSRRAA